MNISPGKTIEYKELIKQIGSINVGDSASFANHFVKRPIFIYVQPSYFDLKLESHGVTITNNAPLANQLKKLETQIMNWVEYQLKNRFSIRHSIVSFDGGKIAIKIEGTIPKRLSVYDCQSKEIDEKATRRFHKLNENTTVTIKGITFYVPRVYLSNTSNSIGIHISIKDIIV